jgi:hypothetical protein
MLTPENDALMERILAEVREEFRSHAPSWWQEWFSPATILLFFTAIGTIISVTWATSSRLTTVEYKIATLEQRTAAMESTLVTREWLQRELSFQSEKLSSYASKASVDLIGQRMEEFQRQLNTIESLQRQINDKRSPR